MSQRVDPVSALPPPRGRHGRVVAMILFLLLIVALSFWGEKGLLGVYRLSGQRMRLMQEIAELRQQNITLRGELEALQRYPSRTEEIARRNLGLVRRGEIVYYFPAESPEPSRLRGPAVR